MRVAQTSVSVWSSTRGAGVKVSAHPNALMLPGHSKIRKLRAAPLSCELGVVAGRHRVFRRTSIELTRAACDPAPPDEQTPQALLQWELVPVTDQQRRGLDDHEHRHHDSPEGGPRPHFPSQVKADASDYA